MERQEGRVLTDYVYGPPTLEKLEQRLMHLSQRVDSIGVSELEMEVSQLRVRLNQLIEQLEDVEVETGLRADRIAIRAVDYMKKIDAMEARRARRWERLGNAALWAFMTAIFLAWLLKDK